MASMRVAVVQLRSGRDPGRNLETVERLVRAAAAAGATYIQTPEMTNLLERDRAALAATLRPEADDGFVALGVALARQLSITLHFGSLALRRDDGRIANRALVFGSDGEVIGRYDKIHMFDVDLAHGESWRESDTYVPGDLAVLADTPAFRLGLGICYDVRFPHLFRAYAHAGAEVLSAPAAFTRQTGEAHWHVLQRARAIENGAFVISAGQGGHHEDGRDTFGHSLVVDPWGGIVAELDHEEPGFVVADIDPAAAGEARRSIPSLCNERRFALVEPA